MKYEFDRPDQCATDDRFSREEVQLALHNKELVLEAMGDDITPTGLHYVMTHFDTPRVTAATWKLEVGGLVGEPTVLTLDDLQGMPRSTATVLLECAGTGRSFLRPRPTGMPWGAAAVSVARWTGVRLVEVLQQTGISPKAVEVLFVGRDQGIENGELHRYARSLPVEEALRPEVLLAYQMNGAPLPREHGAPLRVIAPGRYATFSVKWLSAITVIGKPFDGVQQRAYRYRESADDPGQPVDLIRVRSLARPPGVPDYLTRTRVVEAGLRRVTGRAWSGGGVGIARVEFSADNGVNWTDANLERPVGKYAWRGWWVVWDAVPGRHELVVKATDESGATQPLNPAWNHGGFGNNAAHRIPVVVV